MSQYFLPYKRSGGDIEVELNLSNYATKSDLKNVTHVDVSSFASKTNLASLKTEVHKLNNDAIKKTDYNTKINEIEGKINNTATTDYNTKIIEIESKIASYSNLDDDVSYGRGKVLSKKNYLVFKPINKYFKRVTDSINNTVYVHSW